MLMLLSVIPHEIKAAVMGIIPGQAPSSPSHPVSSSKGHSIENAPLPDSLPSVTGFANPLPPDPTNEDQVAVSSVTVAVPFMVRASCDAILIHTKSSFVS